MMKSAHVANPSDPPVSLRVLDAGNATRDEVENALSAFYDPRAIYARQREGVLGRTVANGGALRLEAP